jgi:hypothetical protein
MSEPAPCPACRRHKTGEGYLLAFLRPHFKDEGGYGRATEFSHYEVFYRCSECGYRVEE